MSGFVSNKKEANFSPIFLCAYFTKFKEEILYTIYKVQIILKKVLDKKSDMRYHSTYTKLDAVDQATSA